GRAEGGAAWRRACARARSPLGRGAGRGAPATKGSERPSVPVEGITNRGVVLGRLLHRFLELLAEHVLAAARPLRRLREGVLAPLSALADLGHGLLERLGGIDAGAILGDHVPGLAVQRELRGAARTLDDQRPGHGPPSGSFIVGSAPGSVKSRRTIVAPQPPRSGGASAKARTRGWRWSRDRTIERCTPEPRPWTSLTSSNPARMAASRYEPTTSRTSRGAKGWRSRKSSVGRTTGGSSSSALTSTRASGRPARASLPSCRTCSPGNRGWRPARGRSSW